MAGAAAASPSLLALHEAMTLTAELHTTVAAHASAVHSLAPALFQTFATIGLGYMLTRFGVIPPSGGRAMATYVSLLAYPAMVFWTLVSMNFGDVYWSFFAVVLLARVAIFLLAVAFELTRHGITGESLANAGIYGIFTSQSNDLAMGIPIVQAVFAGKGAHWTNMLYIVTLTRVFINPFGFWMMEYGRIKILAARRRADARVQAGEANRSFEDAPPAVDAEHDEAKQAIDVAQPGEQPQQRHHEHEQAQPVPAAHPRSLRIEDDIEGGADSEPESERDSIFSPRHLRHILIRVFINPLVISTVAGVVWNLTAHSLGGGRLPGVLDLFFKKLGDSFQASALFVLGIAMHGHLDKLGDRRELNTPLWLFFLKSIALPIISRFLAVAWGLDADWILFVFILGTLPSSEQVPFFAYDYRVPVANMIAPAMVIGTVLAAPVMFVAAQMVNITMTSSEIDAVLVGTMRVFSTFGLIAGAYFLFLLWYNRRFTTRRDKLLIGLIIWQLVLNLSSEFCGMNLDAYSPNLEHLRYGVVFTARMATRFWMLALAVNEVLRYRQLHEPSFISTPKGAEVPSTADEIKYYPYFVWCSLFAAILASALSAIGGHRSMASYEYAECYLRYGRFQWAVIAAVDALSLVVLVYAIWRIKKLRPRKDNEEDEHHDEHSYTRVHDSEEALGATEAHRLAGAQVTLPTKEDTFHDDGDEIDTSSSRDFYAESAAFSARARRRRKSLAAEADLVSPGGATFVRPGPTSPRELESSWNFGMGVFLLLTLIWMVLNLILSVWSASVSSRAVVTEGRIELLLLDGVMSAGSSIWTWLAFGLVSHVKSPLRYVTRWVQKRAASIRI